MVFSKNFLVVLLVFSTVTLCLAKPRWIWLNEEGENDGEWNDEVFKERMKPRMNDENGSPKKRGCVYNRPNC